MLEVFLDLVQQIDKKPNPQRSHPTCVISPETIYEPQLTGMTLIKHLILYLSVQF